MRDHFQIFFCKTCFSHFFDHYRNFRAVLHAFQQGIILIAVTCHEICTQEFKEVKAKAQMFHANFISNIRCMSYQTIYILFCFVITDKVIECIQTNQTFCISDAARSATTTSSTTAPTLRNWNRRTRSAKSRKATTLSLH